MEYIDWIREKCGDVYSNVLKVDIMKIINTATSPPAITSVQSIFVKEDIKYNLEKHSIAFIFVTGNLLINSSICAIELIRCSYDLLYSNVSFYHELYKKHYTDEYLMVEVNEEIVDTHEKKE